MIKEVDKEKLAHSLLCLEFFPYHSERYRGMSTLVPSQMYTFHLLEEAMKRKALIIQMRSKTIWQYYVPELKNHNNYFQLRSPQNVTVSRNNCPEGFDKIIETVNEWGY